MKRLTLIAMMAGLLTSCAAPTSPEAHARRYAFHDVKILSGTYDVDRSGTAKLMLPIFQTAYNDGQQAKANGATLAQAKEAAQELRERWKQDTQSKSQFSGTPNREGDVGTMDADQAKALYAGLAETFMDGFNEGKQTNGAPVDDLLGDLTPAKIPQK